MKNVSKYRWSLFCCLAFTAFFTPSALASEAALVGEWGANGNSWTFFGGGIALETNGGTNAWTKCTFDGNNLTVNRGAGEVETFIYTVSSNEFTTVDSQSQSTTYPVQTSALTDCERVLKQLEGAKALLALDNPDAPPPTIPDVLGYLSAVPSCPHDGTLSTGKGDSPPTCSKCSSAP